MCALHGVQYALTMLPAPATGLCIPGVPACQLRCKPVNLVRLLSMACRLSLEPVGLGLLFMKRFGEVVDCHVLHNHSHNKHMASCPANWALACSKLGTCVPGTTCCTLGQSRGSQAKLSLDYVSTPFLTFVHCEIFAVTAHLGW